MFPPPGGTSSSPPHQLRGEWRRHRYLTHVPARLCQQVGNSRRVGSLRQPITLSCLRPQPYNPTNQRVRIHCNIKCDICERCLGGSPPKLHGQALLCILRSLGISSDIPSSVSYHSKKNLAGPQNTLQNASCQKGPSPKHSKITRCFAFVPSRENSYMPSVTMIPNHLAHTAKLIESHTNKT